MTDLLLIAGQSGSKSTFIGGLYNHVKNRSDASVEYNMLTGNRDEFEQNVLRRMSQRLKYPGQTKQSYAVEFDIETPSAFSKNMTVTFMDIPGEEQREAIDELDKQVIKKKQIEDEWDKRVSERLEDDQLALQKDDGDWKILYKHTYVTCHQVIFLLNINKLIFEEEDPIYGSGLLKKVPGEKRGCALIPTAVDILRYDPSGSTTTTSVADEILGPFGGSTKSADEDLLDLLKQRINVGVSPKANNVITAAEKNDGIDVIGVAVPAEDPDDPNNENLIPDGHSFETQGFGHVTEWLDR